MSDTLRPQDRIRSSERPGIALSVATSLAILAVAVLSLVIIGSDTAYASFNPTGTVSLSDSSPGVNANIRTEFDLPAPNVNFSALIAFTPIDFFGADDNIPIGHGVTFLKAGVTLGLINGPCSPGGLVAEFQMMSATTDISGPTVVFEDDGDPGTTFEIHEGENTDSWATAAELPKGAAKYPDFLLRIFVNENGQTLQPIARLYGQTQVVGNDVSLNFVFFQPGTTFKNAKTGQVFTTDAALGYPSVTVLQDLGDPDVKPNPDSTITDFCTPLSTTTTTCGVAQADRSLMNRNSPCPSDTGTPVRTNPSSDSTVNFVTFTAGLPDADGDGFENSFDTCPYDINEENPRAAAIRDSDMIDPACDPDPDDWCDGGPDSFSIVTKFGQDCDKDGFLNSADNCPLIANPEQGRADADADGIGDACDRDSTTAEGGRPIVALVTPVDIGGGGTPCFTAVEATLDYIRAIDNVCVTSAPTPTPTPTPTPVVVLEKVEEEVQAGETVTTDEDGDGATADDPVEVNVTSPVGDNISIDRTNDITVTPPQGFRFLGWQVEITGPNVTPDDPLIILFQLDSSMLDGANENTIQVFKDGVLVAACSDASGTASPDPCVSDRALVDGDVEITVLTSTASSWNFGVAATVAGDSTGPAGGVATGVGSLAPLASSIPTWAAIVSALGGAGILGSLGAFASRIIRRRR